MSAPRRFDVLTMLDVCVDLLLSGDDVVPEFGQKEKLIGDYTLEMGGSACIFACQSAKLGLRTAGVGVAGRDDFGDLVCASLSGSGVNIGWIQRSGTVKTGLGVLLCAPADRAILTYNGTIEAVRNQDVTDEMLQSARHLHIASFYLQKQLDWVDIVRRAKACGCTVSLDTNWDPAEKWEGVVRELLPHIDVFMPNENEACLISGQEDLNEAVRFLGERVPTLVVKRGAGGALSFIGGEALKLSAMPTTVVDTVGAGDSFDGGYLWGYLNGCEPEACLRAGLYCGAQNVKGRGGTSAQAREPELQLHIKSMGGLR